MSNAKQLAIQIGGYEVDVKSMSRTQVRELDALRRAATTESQDHAAVQHVHEYLEHLLKELYPQLAAEFNDLPNRELLVLTTVTEQYSAAMPVEVIETLIKNA